MFTSISPPPDATHFSDELHEYLANLFGSNRTLHLAKALREPGAWFYLRTNTLRTTSEELQKALEEEGIQSSITDPTIDALAIPIQPTPLVPRHQKVVVADKAGSENVMLGSHLYRPGVIQTDKFAEGDPVTIVNPRGHIVGSGITAGDSRELQARNKGLFVRVTHPFYRLPSLTDLQAYQRGLFYSQSLPAILVAPILNPQPGETIIDICAAPGGKTTHIAQLIENQGTIIAVDRSARRLKRLTAEVERLGITCVEPYEGRANQFVEAHPTLQADRILVDPPCTALGVRPKLYDETTRARILSTASYQRDILDSAVSLLRPNGILVYSTCTLTIEENEHNIQYLLNSKKFKLEPQTPYIGTNGFFEAPLLRDKLQRIYPDTHNLPGYFIAKLRKIK